MPANIRPPYDPELAAALTLLAGQAPPTVTSDMIELLRAAPITVPIEQVLDGREVSHRELMVPGHQGDDIALSVLARNDHDAPGPGIYYIHSGGMFTGDRFTGVGMALDWVEQFDAVCVSVEYRLAPEFRDPFLIEDCYAGLVWTADRAAELGIDAKSLMIVGGSAGGGLAAGTALLARDRQGPQLSGQVLVCPMLDDRNQTVSSHQFVGVGVWDRDSNATGWAAYLGDRHGTDDVSRYAAPSRATDLSGLPPAYIDVGSAEVFRDEAVDYASQIWADGGVAELHVWSGGCHGFDLLAPDARVSKESVRTRTNWVARHLGCGIRASGPARNASTSAANSA